MSDILTYILMIYCKIDVSRNLLIFLTFFCFYFFFKKNFCIFASDKLNFLKDFSYERNKQFFY